MSELSFQQKYEKVLLKNNSLLCIGLDPDFEKIPFSLRGKPETAIIEFNKAIIQATNGLVCAYKLNSAFYEAQGEIGIKQLKDTCDLLKYSYPDIITILDIKRGDVSHTNQQYVKFAYDYLGVDAVTLHPYLGKESLMPFLSIPNKGNFILCRTSNPGAGELQDMLVDGQPLYQKIALKTMTEWNDNHNCMLVVGAPYPQEVADIRKMVGDKALFLVPGIGAQAGDLQKVVKAGMNSKTDGLLISASRSIIHASTDSDFFIKAKEIAEKLKNDINAFRSGQVPEEDKEENNKETSPVEQPAPQTQQGQTQQPAAPQNQEPLSGAQAILQKIAQSQKEDAAKEAEEAKKEEEEKKANPFGKPFVKVQLPPMQNQPGEQKKNE